MLSAYCEKYFFFKVRIQSWLEVQHPLDNVMDVLLFFNFSLVTFYNFLNKIKIFVVFSSLFLKVLLEAYKHFSLIVDITISVSMCEVELVS